MSLSLSVDDAELSRDISNYWQQLPERAPFSPPITGSLVHRNRSLSPQRLLFLEDGLFGEPSGGWQAGTPDLRAVQTPQRHTVASRLRHAINDEHMFRKRYTHVMERYALLQDEFKEQALRVLSLEQRSAGLREKLRIAESQQSDWIQERHRLLSQLRQAQDAIQAMSSAESERLRLISQLRQAEDAIQATSKEQLQLRRVATEVAGMLTGDFCNVSQTMAREVADLSHAARAEANRRILREGLVRERAVGLLKTIRDSRMQIRAWGAWEVALKRARRKWALDARGARFRWRQAAHDVLRRWVLFAGMHWAKRVQRNKAKVYSQKVLRRLAWYKWCDDVRVARVAIDRRLAFERRLLIRNRLNVCRYCRAVLCAWAEQTKQRSQAGGHIARKTFLYQQGLLARAMDSWRASAADQARVRKAIAKRAWSMFRGTIARALELWRKSILITRILRRLLGHQATKVISSSFDEWARVARKNRKMAKVLGRITNSSIYTVLSTWHHAAMSSRSEAQEHKLQAVRLLKSDKKRANSLAIRFLSIWQSEVSAATEILLLNNRVKRFKDRSTRRALRGHLGSWVWRHTQTSLLLKSARLYTIRSWRRQMQRHMVTWACKTAFKREQQKSVRHLITRVRQREVSRCMQTWVWYTTNKRHVEQSATQETRACSHIYSFIRFIYCTRQKGWALRNWRESTRGARNWRKRAHTRRRASAKAERVCERKTVEKLRAVFGMFVTNAGATAARLSCLSAACALIRDRHLHTITGQCMEEWRGAVEARHASEKRQREEERRAHVSRLLFRDLRASWTCRCVRNVLCKWGSYAAQTRRRKSFYLVFCFNLSLFIICVEVGLLRCSTAHVLTLRLPMHLLICIEFVTQ